MTELNRVVAWLDDARTAIADLLELRQRPDDVVALMRATKLIDAAITAVQAAMPCRALGGLTRTRVCQLAKGHAGRHREGLFEWDAESENAFAKTMGKLD